MNNGYTDRVAFIWSVADKLRGTYKQSEYGRVILPLVVLRRLDCVLEPTREQVRQTAAETEGQPAVLRHKMVTRAAGQTFYNTSRFDFATLLADPNHLAANLLAYINGFSDNARDIVERFRLENQIERMDRTDILFEVVKRFAEVDLHPDAVDNHHMGSIFEELIRRFSEQSNETAGEHFTPREVIRLMVNLLFAEDDDALRRPGIIRTMYDPACGTGGMLSVAQEYLAELNPDANLEVFGQELNEESYAICKSDMMLKGQDPENVKFGNSFTHDGLEDASFHYCISNPPFGVEWKTAAPVIKAEHEARGYAGRFGAGLPRINDGSLLFLQHMISKMKRPEDGGTRVAIVFNGSPLFTGAAGSGESEIRRWIIDNDWLEAIVALPDQMFYNTGINTYVWIVTNRKAPARKRKVQLINGVSFFQKMRRSLGDKRKELGTEHIDEITRLYGEFQEGDHVRIFDNAAFGYHRITVERPLKLNFQVSPERIARLDEQKGWTNLLASRKKGVAGEAEITAGHELQQEVLAVLEGMDADTPYRDRTEFLPVLNRALKRSGVKVPAALKKAVLAALSERDESADPCLDRHGDPEPDTDLRDYENVPLTEDIDEYMEREVLPHVPDAWVDVDKTKVGFEIPFTRHFYEYTPPRPLGEIEAEIRALEAEIQGMLGEVLG